MTTPRVRFAPSPTGDLHIGNVRTALFGWLWARKTGGTFILRIEDTDQERSNDASRDVVFETLDWLGLDWDEGPTAAGLDRGTHGPYRQMQRLDIYRAWAEELVEDGKAYRCYCTQADLDTEREAFAAMTDSDHGFKYPGTCRGRTDEPDLPYVIRFIADRSGSVTYDDLVFGSVNTPNTELQDFVLMRSDGVPLYNFGAVVDDIEMGITLVSRGRDHMINTPPQILLYRAFDAPIPAFAHLPLLLTPDGVKLSKRHGASCVREYRETGCAPGALLNYLARLGWSHGNDEIFSRAALVAAFDWSGCGQSDSRIDPKKLSATNHAHLQSSELVSDREYVDRLLPFLAARGLTVTHGDATRALFAIRERAQTFVQAADLLDPFFRDSPIVDDAAARRFLVPEVAPQLRHFRNALTRCDDWTPTALDRCTSSWLAAANLTLKQVGQPLRVALTGRAASPSLFDVLFVLGRDRSLARLDQAATRAESTKFEA